MSTLTNAQCTSPPYTWTNLDVMSSNICAVDPTDLDKNFCALDWGVPLMTNEGKFYSVIGNKQLIKCLTCLTCLTRRSSDP